MVEPGQVVKDPLASNAARRDFLEMLMISLISSLCGGQTCVDTADFAAMRRSVVGLRQGRRRERNIVVGIRKFCKSLPREGGHGVSGGYATCHCR